MKLELKENMYVRTKDGYISQYKYYDTTNIGKLLCIPLSNRTFANIEDIVKTSYNIIDILEAGDFVSTIIGECAVIAGVYNDINSKKYLRLCNCIGEYYEDDIRPFFERKWSFLYDFNMEICTKMCELLDIRPNIQLTSEYIPSDDMRLVGAGEPKDSCIVDYREVIRPKHPLPDNSFSVKPYYQVFERKNGFIPNLSILDLLFNMGNESIFWL